MGDGGGKAEAEKAQWLECRTRVKAINEYNSKTKPFLSVLMPGVQGVLANRGADRNTETVRLTVTRKPCG